MQARLQAHAAVLGPQATRLLTTRECVAQIPAICAILHNGLFNIDESRKAQRQNILPMINKKQSVGL
jgi:hypothetical protein